MNIFKYIPIDIADTLIIIPMYIHFLLIIDHFLGIVVSLALLLYDH